MRPSAFRSPKSAMLEATEQNIRCRVLVGVFVEVQALADVGCVKGGAFGVESQGDAAQMSCDLHGDRSVWWCALNQLYQRILRCDHRAQRVHPGKSCADPDTFQ